MMDLLPHLDDEARCWVYAADRSMTEAEATVVQDAMDAFFAAWTSHGRTVRGGAAVVEARFVVVAGQVDGGDLSGCGIDKSVHALEEAGRRLGIAWNSGLGIAYRDADGGACVVDRPTFRRLVADGAVDAATTVYDLAESSLGSLRANGLARQAGSSWHARVFGLPRRQPA